MNGKPEIMGIAPYFAANLPARNRSAIIWQALFRLSTIIGMVVLVLLLYTVVNKSFGLVAINNKVNPETLAVKGVPIEQLDKDALVKIIQDNISKGKFRQLEREKPMAERSLEEVYAIVIADLVKPKDIVGTWDLPDSIIRRDEIIAQVYQDHPAATVKFRSWLNPHFIDSPQSSDPLTAGVRTAILGSLFTILITIVVAFPIGVGASIYLEEYAKDNRLNRLLQTNITNLAGVPSIIYGMLGLAIFVRGLVSLTS